MAPRYEGKPTTGDPVAGTQTSDVTTSPRGDGNMGRLDITTTGNPPDQFGLFSPSPRHPRPYGRFLTFLHRKLEGPADRRCMMRRGRSSLWSSCSVPETEFRQSDQAVSVSRLVRMSALSTLPTFDRGRSPQTSTSLGAFTPPMRSRTNSRTPSGSTDWSG